MEWTSSVFNYYSLFVLTTLICILILNRRALTASGVDFGFTGSIVYYFLTTLIVVILAPFFFFIFVFQSEMYYEKVLEVLIKQKIKFDE